MIIKLSSYGQDLGHYLLLIVLGRAEGQGDLYMGFADAEPSTLFL